MVLNVFHLFSTIFGLKKNKYKSHTLPVHIMRYFTRKVESRLTVSCNKLQNLLEVGWYAHGHYFYGYFM